MGMRVYPQMTTVGVISDTHGLLRQEVLAAFEDADVILHAGDVGDPNIIDRLNAIAPVHAVLGNVDTGDWLPQSVTVTIEGCRILLVHDINDASSASGFDALVYGHSHKPLVEVRDGVLLVNPGSAGPRRFKLPATVARMRIDGRSVTAELVPIAE
jgi:uncharacterized protein